MIFGLFGFFFFFFFSVQKTMFDLIELDAGMEVIQLGITKVKNILEGLPEPKLSSAECMKLHNTVYTMCTQPPPYSYAQQLYDKHREAFEEYITSMVLPSLREKHGELMLREFVKRWSNNKMMVRLLSIFFHYLDQYFTVRTLLPSCKEVGLICFRDLVYKEMKKKVRDAVISLIDREREGEEIDRVLLKNVLDIFVELGMGYYRDDFEEAMLKDTAVYYSRKASVWVSNNSCRDYMLKAEECLKREKDRVSHYLHASSETKLLQKVRHELLSVSSVHATKLLEKMHLGSHPLLRDEKAEDFMDI
ncbi:hypothetical protein ABFS82_14G009600 [Erythranthe guttata]